jgi:MFS superfamily sulfate permease-like transporter
VLALAPVAVVLAVLGYAESASVAQDLATRHGYDVDPDRELLAIGAANGLAGLFQGFIVAGGASQSAANDRAGAQTQAAGVVVAGLALVTAFALTPLFFDLPDAVLGAIVLYAILGFFRVGALRRIAHLRRDSFALAVFALAAVLVLGVLPGLILAVFLSLILLLSRVARPGMTTLGRAPGVAVYGDLEAHPDFQTLPGLLLVRPNGMLFFGDVRAVRQQILELARDVARGGSSPAPGGPDAAPLRVVALDLQMTPNLDIETADTLAELRETLAAEGVELWLAGVHEPVRRMLGRSGYLPPTGEAPVFPDLGQAVEAFSRSAGGPRPAPPRPGPAPG